MATKIIKSQDETLLRNNFNFVKKLDEEHKLIKQRKHPMFKFVKDLYSYHHISRQAFYKYLAKYKASPTPLGVSPKKRGPKFKKRRAALYCIEENIIKLRELGCSKEQIHYELRKKYKRFAPSKSTVYNIMLDKGVNKLRPKMKANKRRIIKEKAGELGHIDCYNLPKGCIEAGKAHYLVGIIDSATRVTLVELIEDKTALTVMFATMDILGHFADYADITFKEILTDNGSEFGQGKDKNNKDTHSFERLLKHLNIKHRYTRPYRPQTNGKIERFWKTIHEELVEDADFDNIEDFKQSLGEYLAYYNQERVHSGIGGITPYEFNEKCPRIS